MAEQEPKVKSNYEFADFILRGIQQQAEAVQPDPYRVEIKQAANGTVQVSTRATHTDFREAVTIAVKMYHDTQYQLLEQG